MSDIAIRVEDLGKRYRIGGPKEPYGTLRDSLVSMARMPLRAMQRGRANGHQEFWALRDVSFEVKRGEVLGVIGRNGAGKSTLLKILSRITEPTEGYAEISGRVGSLLEVGTGFHPELTGRENIYLNGAILGMKKAEIERAFDEIVTFAEIETFLDTPVKRYSSGMYMRLAFSIAAHLEPEILIVDEVLAVGDAAFQKKCLGKMGDVAHQGRTVLFVSHNMAAVAQLCSRAVLLSNARIETTGIVNDVIQTYINITEVYRKREGEILARSDDGSVELLSVQPIDERGHHRNAVQCGHDVLLQVSLSSTITVPNLIVSISINTAYNGRIAVLHSGITDSGLAVSPGTHSVVCNIPDFPLAAGSYIIDAKVSTPQGTILWAPGVEQLTVEPGDFYATGRMPDPNWAGVCYLRQRWEVRNIE